MALTLDVAISTYSPEGIKRVSSMNVPRVEGVRYVVSWQAHDNYPVPESLASRPDVEIHRLDVLGLSHNRNNAIECCRGDIILTADDDLIYTPEGLQSIIHTFEENPEVDVATFICDHPGDSVYPSEPTDLRDPWPKGYQPGTWEISVRRSTAGARRFCPELGLASPRMHAAEDVIFLYSLIKQGYRCRFFPITICRHPAVSTGYKKNLTAEHLRAFGCSIRLMYPLTVWPRVVLKAWRVSKASQATFLRALRYIWEGALEAPAMRRRNRDTLW